MRRSLMAVASVAMLAWPATAAEPPKYGPLFDALWQTVDDHFYDPSFHGLDWRAIGARYRAKLPRVTNDAGFERLATAMLSELGTSHLYVVPPKDSTASGTGVAVRWRTISGQPIAAEIDPLSDAGAAGLKTGDRLLSPMAAVPGTKGSIATLRVQSCSGATRTLNIRRLSALWPPVHPGFAWHRVSWAPGHSIGYLRIDRFDDGADTLADKAMAELKDTDGLIVDIRANSGGNLSALRLASYFWGASEPAVALLARDYLKALGHPVTAADIAHVAPVAGAYTDEAIFAAVGAHNGAAMFMSEDMGAKRYAKPVVVLIGEDTGSAAEGFGWLMRRHSGAKFVGRQTAGALLSGEEFDLPDGWHITIPVQGVWAADGTDYRDKALSPDVPVALSRADICAGRDSDIARALKILGAP